MSSGIQGAPSGAPAPTTLAENEAIIERGLTSFVDVGQALMRIRDERQYRGTHPTFERYCRERWKFSENYASKQIAAARVSTIVLTQDLPSPATESVARELRSIKDPDAMVDAWKTAVERHGPKPTAAQTKRVIEERTGPKAAPEPKAKAEGREKIPLCNEETILAWVGKRMRAGKNRDEIYAEAVARSYDRPFPEEDFSKNGVDAARAILLDRKRRGDSNRRRGPSESGKRLRGLHAEKRAGRQVGDLWHLQVAIAEAAGRVEAFYLPDLDWSEETDTMILDIRDDLLRHAAWNDAAFDVVVAHMSDLSRQRTYNLLVTRANDPSSTPNERATAARLAERWRRKQNAARLSP